MKKTTRHKLYEGVLYDGDQVIYDTLLERQAEEEAEAHLSDDIEPKWAGGDE